MNIIDFTEAKRSIFSKRRKKNESLCSIKLRYMSNCELFREYKVYRETLEDLNCNCEDVTDSENLVYLCEVMMEVVTRGLLEDFNRRFDCFTGIVE